MASDHVEEVGNTRRRCAKEVCVPNGKMKDSDSHMITITAVVMVAPAVRNTFCEICRAISHAALTVETTEDVPLSASPAWQVDDAECPANVNEWNGQNDAGRCK